MDEYRIRVRIFIGIIVVVLGILGLRLAQLQLVNQEEYSVESRGNAIKANRITPARGAVYDRTGKLMVSNEPTYTVTITPRYFDASNIPMLANAMGVTDSTVAAKLQQARQRSPFQSFPAFKEVPFKNFSRVQEHLYELPGVNYEVDQNRRFISDAEAAHAIGYIREISSSELEGLRDEGYRMGDLIGKTGLEAQYEEFLRGRMGIEYRFVNVHGRDMGPYEEADKVQPVSGYNLHTTLDAGVQALAESLMVNKRGGAVALDPQSGEIIALASAPDYNPEVFTQSVDQQTWQYLTTSEEKPMYNRATLMGQPPGSTWKPFMALMALQEGYITKEETYSCPGYHPVGGPSIFRCMHVHGAVSVIPAIQHSCNTFFFEMMRRANLDAFSRYAHMFGFGEKVRTDIGEQSPGLIPDSSYFNNMVGEGNWGIGYTMSLGIGQGNMSTTPLQLAQYVSIVANKGTKYPPHLVKKMTHPETGETIYPTLPEPEQLPIDEENFEIVRQGMKLVMEGGTGYYVQIPGISSGGKTGTAQNPHGEDHSVFIMFAPYENPQIGIGVIIENAGYGGSVAGPIATLMAEKYLKGELSDSPDTQRNLKRALAASSEPIK